jgi:hypothetical protein
VAVGLAKADAVVEGLVVDAGDEGVCGEQLMARRQIDKKIHAITQSFFISFPPIFKVRDNFGHLTLQNKTF